MKGKTWDNLSSVIKELHSSNLSVQEYLRQNPGCPIKQGCLYKHLKQEQQHGSVLPDQRTTGKSRAKRVLEPMVLAIIWIILQEMQASPGFTHRLLNYLIVNGPTFWRSFPAIGLRTIEFLAHEFGHSEKRMDAFADHLTPARIAIGLAIDLCPTEPDELWQGDAYELTPKKLNLLRLDAITDQDGDPVRLHIYHIVEAASGYIMPQHCTINRRPDSWDVALSLYGAVVPTSPAMSAETGKPTILRLDRGGECRGFFRLGIAQQLGIEVQFTPRETPKLNSRVERAHRTIAGLLRILLRNNPDLIRITKYGRTISLPDLLMLLEKARVLHNTRPRRGYKVSPKDIYVTKKPRSRGEISGDQCKFGADITCRVDYRGTLRLGSRRYASTDQLAGEKVRVRASIHGGELYAMIMDSTGGSIDELEPL